MKLPEKGASFFMPTEKFLRITLVLFCAVSCALILIHFPYTPDDTYIYLQYAKNISHGNGISFNSGIPSYGCTGPLWMFIATTGFFLSIDPWIAIKSIDIIFITLSFVIFFRLLRLHFRDYSMVILGMSFFLFDVWLIRWAGSGMETSFSIFLVCCILFFETQKKVLFSIACSGLLTLVRPEAVIFFGLIIFALVISNKKSIPLVLYSLLIYGFFVIPWVIFSFVYFGSVVPNTLLGKTSSHNTVYSFFHSIGESLLILLASQPVLLICISICLFIVFYNRIVISTKSKKFFLWPIVLVTAYAFGNVQIVSRYLLLIIPPLILGGIILIEQVVEIFQNKKIMRPTLMYVVVAVSFATSQGMYWLNVYPHTTAFQKVTESGLKPIAQWLSQNSAINSKIVAPDVGIIGYYSNRNIYDPAGLIVPQMRNVFRDVGYDEGMENHLYEKIVIPDYVIDRSSSKERLKSDQLKPIITTESVSLGLRNTQMVFYTIYQRMPDK